MAVRTPIRQLKGEISRVEHEFFRTITTMVASAFGLVAALAWNTAITKILERYAQLKPESSVFSWLAYAIVVTLIAVLITVYLGRLAKDKSEAVEDAKERANG